MFKNDIQCLNIMLICHQKLHSSGMLPAMQNIFKVTKLSNNSLNTAYAYVVKKIYVSVFVRLKAMEVTFFCNQDVGRSSDFI